MEEDNAGEGGTDFPCLSVRVYCGRSADSIVFFGK